MHRLEARESETVRCQHGNRGSGGSSAKAKPWARVSFRVGMLAPEVDAEAAGPYGLQRQSFSLSI